MTLGALQTKVKIDNDRVQAQELVGRPLLIDVREYFPEFTSPKFPVPKPVVIVDVVDLTTGRIYVGPLWGTKQPVDALSGYAGSGTILPVKLETKTSGTGNPYLYVSALEGQELANANAWYAQYPQAMAQSRAAKEQQAQAAAAQQQTMAPMQVQGAPTPQAPQQYVQPQQDPQYAAWLASQQPAQTPAQPQYAPQAPQSYAPQAPQQYAQPVAQQPAPAAPQYQPQPAAPQSYQQPAPASQAPAPATWQQPAAPQPQQYAPQQGAPAAPMNPNPAPQQYVPTAPNPGQFAAPVAPQLAQGQVGGGDIQAAIANLNGGYPQQA